MKKLLLLAMVILSGCARTHTLTKIEREYGRPARVEIECISGVVCDENTYYNNRDVVQYIYWFYYWNEGRWPRPKQEVCWEVKADKNGKVISSREYIEQKNREQSDRTPIQGRKGEKLPGVN